MQVSRDDLPVAILSNEIFENFKMYELKLFAMSFAVVIRMRQYNRMYVLSSFKFKCVVSAREIVTSKLERMPMI